MALESNSASISSQASHSPHHDGYQAEWGKNQDISEPNDKLIMDKDTVGKASRISRRVKIRKVGLRSF